MTPKELRAIGLAAYGPEWQSPLARAIGVGPRHIRKLLSGEAAISPAIEADILRALGAEERLDPDRAWPRDAWIIGDGPEGKGGTRREYLVHTRLPRFIARVVDEDADDEEGPADTDTGVVYRAGGALLCEVVWLDPPPGPKALLDLMERAADALEND